MVYFLKIITLGGRGIHICRGECEFLGAIHAVKANFMPQPYSWGQYDPPTSAIRFRLAEFLEVGEQVYRRYSFELSSGMTKPFKLADCSVQLPQNSQPHTGDFGDHVTTYYAKIVHKVTPLGTEYGGGRKD
ncbi:MAG: hypothetical protein Q9220_006424 [cf. Caloplaca sp. 1 TL-2023]